MLNQRQYIEFENWAKKRVPFSYNKYTKRLICMSKHFDELHESFKLDAITNWLDSKDFHISVSPHIGDETLVFYSQVDCRYNDYTCCFKNLINGEKQVYFYSRFEATKEAIILALKLENDNNNASHIPHRNT